MKKKPLRTRILNYIYHHLWDDNLKMESHFMHDIYPYSKHSEWMVFKVLWWQFLLVIFSDRE